MGFFSRCVKSKKKAAAYEKAEAAKRAKDGPEGTVVKAPRRLLPRCTKRRFGGEFWDLLVFGLFAVLFGNYLYGSLSGHKFYISLYLDNALTQGEWYPKKTFMTTLDTNEWSVWLRDLFVPTLYPTENYMGQPLDEDSRRYLADGGPMRVGLVRIRQLRMETGRNCAVPSQFEESCLNCVGPYAYRRHGELVDTDKWTFTEYEEPTAGLRHSPYWSVGAQQFFGYGGHTIVLNASNPQAQLLELKRTTWLDRNTRGVWVEFTLYTPDVDILSICQIATIYSPAGDLIPEYHWYHVAMRDVMFMFDTYDNAFYTVNLMLLNVYVIVKFAYELFVVYGFAGHWSFYFRDAYRLIEFVNLLCFFITVVLRLAIRQEFAPLMKDFSRANEVYFDTIHLRDLCLWCDRVNAINAILSVMKFFKYVRFSKTLTLPVDVLMLSMTRMAVLSVVIGILLVGYAISFDMMFGFTIAGYRTFTESLLTLVKCVFGDFSFGELLAANRYMGPLLLISFWMIIYLIVLSMFFSMVSGAQDEIVEFNESHKTSATPVILKDLAYASSGVCRVLNKMPFVRAFVPSADDLLKLANKEELEPGDTPRASPVDDDGGGGGDDGDDAEDDGGGDDDDGAALDDEIDDDEELRRTVFDPSVVVLEAIRELEVGQKEIAEQMKIAVARRRALNEAHKVESQVAVREARLAV